MYVHLACSSTVLRFGLVRGPNDCACGRNHTLHTVHMKNRTTLSFMLGTGSIRLGTGAQRRKRGKCLPNSEEDGAGTTQVQMTL